MGELTRYERLLIYFMNIPVVHRLAIWLWNRKVARDLRQSLDNYFNQQENSK